MTFWLGFLAGVLAAAAFVLFGLLPCLEIWNRWRCRKR